MDLRLKRFSIPPYLLTNLEIQKHYQNEHRFSGIYSREYVNVGAH